MKSEEIAALLSEKLGHKVIESKLGVVTPWTVVDPGVILEACRLRAS